MKRVFASGAFDDLRFADFRFLGEAAALGEVHAILWPDDVVARVVGEPPKLPLPERAYFLNAIRFVATLTFGASLDSLPADAKADVWAIRSRDLTDAKRRWCDARGIDLRVVDEAALKAVPNHIAPPPPPTVSARKRVIVTGCFDWFHTGHVRFFEECAEIGDLYVCVGHDENIRLLKGDGHPLFPATQRRYIASTIRHVAQALVTTGTGWMDAAPEIERLKPDVYAVNEDGDKPDKLAFCAAHGIEYRVLKRLPKAGLPRRASTTLRGF